MNSTRLILWAIAIVLTAAVADARGRTSAHPPTGTIGMTIKVSNAWVEAPAAGQNAAPMYMEISSDTSANLISAFSRAAKSVELRKTPEGGGAQDRPVSVIAIDSTKPTMLTPDGNHLVLVNLVEPLAKDGLVPVTLTFFGRDGQRKVVQVEAQVR